MLLTCPAVKNVICNYRQDIPLLEHWSTIVEITIAIDFALVTDPGPVSNVIWDPQSDSSVKVSWSTPLRPNGIVLKYHIGLVNYIGGELIDFQNVSSSTFMFEFTSEELG